MNIVISLYFQSSTSERQWPTPSSGVGSPTGFFFLLPGLPDWIETSATPPSPRTFFADRRHCQHAAYQFLFVVVVVVVVVRRLPSFADEPAFADVARLFFLVSECVCFGFFLFFFFLRRPSRKTRQTAISAASPPKSVETL